MNFQPTDENRNYIEQQLDGEPCINVVSKEEFEKRIDKVFHLLWETLTKTFGPGGSGTFISVYPATYNSKDGFHIMKNIQFDKKLDQIISDLVMDICSRLNFTVGDGTTTAVIATKNIYDEYRKNRDWFESQNVLPRDIMNMLENIKKHILKNLTSLSEPIQSDDPIILKENIRRVVQVSSNGDEDLTNMIADLYEELCYPAITCKLAKDGVTRSTIIKGYNIDVTLTDVIYVNNDDNTMVLGATDVIIFDHKVDKDTYTEILRPLTSYCAMRNRHLLCIAPFYDEHALNGIIRKDLLNEYNRRHDASLVLAACSRPNGAQKARLNDLAMLLNTMPITTDLEREIIEAMKDTAIIGTIFNVDNRQIKGSLVGVVNNGNASIEAYESDFEKCTLESQYDGKQMFRVGYCEEAELGMKESTFKGFSYDEELYKKYLELAKKELEETRRKCKVNGTFSPDLAAKQQRYYSLGLKIGVIEVGASSEMSQGYLKDVVDDAVKAAASAYHNGVVKGCNVTLLQCLYDYRSTLPGSCTELLLVDILIEGFENVYKNVLSNVLKNSEWSENWAVSPHNILLALRNTNGIAYTLSSDRADIVDNALSEEEKLRQPSTMFDAVVRMSLITSTVFDLSKNAFSSGIINSTETDREILKATIDLLALLITGNQLVLR